MAILDELTPAYYEVLRLGMQRQNGEVVTIYDIAIYNVDNRRMAIINRGSTLTPQERQAVVAIFTRDKAAFETATGLTEYVPPPPEPEGEI